MKIKKIKVLEPECNPGIEESSLTHTYDHPARFRYTKGWVTETGQSNRIYITPVNEGGQFLFVDGYCSNYQAQYEAWIEGNGLLEESTQPDRYELVS